MGHKDLRLGKIVYILVFYNISFSWFLPLDGFQFKFLLRDSENDLYCPHSTTLSFRLQFLSFIDHFLLMDPVRGSFVMASVFLQSYSAALAG